MQTQVVDLLSDIEQDYYKVECVRTRIDKESWCGWCSCSYQKEYQKIQNILKGTRRRRLEARSVEELNLLTELEELEDLVEYQEFEIDELEGDIQNFYRDLHEAN